MKNTKKILSIFLALIMIISIVPMSTITASAEDSATSGTCGENLTWNFDESTGTLTISGTGAMNDYTPAHNSRPWANYSIVSVIISNGVTIIGDYAFYFYKNLTSVTIPDSVTTIGNYAFHCCESLTRVTIPDSVTTIGSNAFSDCDSLTSVTIPDSVTTIGDKAFGYCNSFTSITVDNNNQHYSSNEDGVLFNKDKTTLVQYPIGNTRTNYTIPDSVTTIGSYAFYDCDSLTSIIIPDGVTTIGSYAFYYCYYLTSVTIPNSVTTIGSFAFHYCYSLTSIIIPDSVTTIGSDAFSDCDSLTSVTIPDSVTTIGSDAFYDCDSLTNITVDSNNQYYSSDEYGILFNKDKTTLVQYPMGNTRTSYIIPNSVTIIGSYAFNCCYSLTSIIIPDSVTTIGSYAFSDCYSLTSIIIPDSVTTIGSYAFSYCYNLTSVTIPNSVTMIGSFAFSYCYSLTSVTIPDSVATISGAAFAACLNLTSITIPDSITTIDNGAFYYSDSLTDVYYSGTEEQWNAITIGEGNDPLLNATIHFLGEHTCSFGEWETVTEPTCTEQGVKERVCSCGKKETDSIPAQGHTQASAIKENEVPATCAVDGSYDLVVYCSVCNIELSRENIIVEATGEHIYSTEKERVEPTCGEDGYVIMACGCGESEEKILPATGEHESKTIEIIEATCKQQGMQYEVCENCGVTLSDIVNTSKLPHTPGGWEVTVEATSTTKGEKVQKCTVCGDIIATDIIPATGDDTEEPEDTIGTVVDEDTGIILEYPKNKYDGEVDISVEKTVNETAYQLIDTKTNATNKVLYNIKMTVDGIESQPDGTVKVRIPLPDGFNSENSYVIHIDTKTGKVERIESFYEDGYMIFETSHFSYYAIIEEYNYTFSIQEPSRTEIRNKDGIILHANVEGTASEGTYVKWESSNGNFDEDADGSNLEIIAKNKGYTTFTAILCAEDGTELARDSVELYSKSGFFDKIGGFFRSLFGMTKIYEN